MVQFLYHIPISTHCNRDWRSRIQVETESKITTMTYRSAAITCSKMLPGESHYALSGIMIVKQIDRGYYSFDVQSDGMEWL